MRLLSTVPLSSLLFSLCVVASSAAHADTLSLDSGLLQDAVALLSPAQQTRVAVDVATNEGGSGYRSSVTPEGKAIGIGIQVGFPTALTAKFSLAGNTALVVGVGAFGGNRFAYFTPSLSVHVDYLWTPSVLANGGPFVLSWYIGIGGWATIYGSPQGPAFAYYGTSNFTLAARVPIGLDMALQTVPIELYLEAVPAVLVFPGIDFAIGASLGARFWF